MNTRVWVGLLFLLAILSPACGPPSEDAGPVTVELSADRLMKHIETLSSDAFGGRAPGSPGEEKTVAYLRDRFTAHGLAPGNPDGTFVQNVPLVGITSESRVSLVRGGEDEALTVGVGYVAWTKRVVEEVSIDEELVFVGYGAVAPEYDWDDYKDVDVRGKVLVMLVNDPPVEGIFGDEAMTYYGRWTYKYEIAAEKGVAGAFVVHETVPAGYPWEVVSGGSSGEQFDLETEDKNMGRVAVEGWFSLEAAQSLFEKAGLDFDAQKRAAADRSFRPVALGARLTATIENTMRNVDSANVVARLEGSEAPDETVLYVAHWDHLGMVESMEGDNIFNGAYDNATGVAGLLELARVFGELDPAPRRSVVFVGVTAEEQGLLGSRYYAEQPLYPTNKTVAAINMDGLNIWGRTSDITVVGLGQSDLDDLAREVATGQGRIIRPDAEPEKGFYYRSDHFELAKVGIPSFYADVGISFEGKPEGWGEEQRAIYTAEDYHKPSDEIKDWYEYSGMIQDLEFFFEMGQRLAGGDGWPEWSETSEFRARREASRE